MYSSQWLQFPRQPVADIRGLVGPQVLIPASYAYTPIRFSQPVAVPLLRPVADIVCFPHIPSVAVIMCLAREPPGKHTQTASGCSARGCFVSRAPGQTQACSSLSSSPWLLGLSAGSTCQPFASPRANTIPPCRSCLLGFCFARHPGKSELVARLVYSYIYGSQYGL